MAISGNPKIIAYDVARGVTHFTAVNLKRYTVADFKVIISNLQIVQREIRAEQVPQDDVMAIKEKNQKLTRLNTAVSTIHSYCKKNRIRI
jgi:hypothetical protein